MDTQVQKLNPAQDAKRSMLRLLGWVLSIAGLVLIVFGAIRMFEPAWSDEGGFVRTDMPFQHQFEDLSSRHRGAARSAFGGFAIVAAGMFIAAAGGVMLKFGYMGTIARYVAAEAAPVAADTINYMGNRTQQGVHDISAAVSTGWHAGLSASAPPRRPTSDRPPVQGICPKCGATNAGDARFCNQCGGAIGA